MADFVISDFLTSMVSAFSPQKAAGIDATIQLKLTGVQPGEWFFIIKDGNCLLTPGLAPKARLTVTCDSDNFVKIFSGKMDGMQAYMQGRIRLLGDINLALKLVGLFKQN